MYDAKTEAILGSLRERPFPLDTATLVELTEMPYSTLSRRLGQLVAEGILEIAATSGPKNRTAYYRIAENNTPLTIQWPVNGELEEMTYVQFYKYAMEFPYDGAIAVQIQNVLIALIEDALVDRTSVRALAEYKAKLENTQNTLEIWTTIVNRAISNPTWNNGTVRATVMRDPDAEELLKAFIRENESS